MKFLYERTAGSHPIGEAMLLNEAGTGKTFTFCGLIELAARAVDREWVNFKSKKQKAVTKTITENGKTSKFRHPPLFLFLT